MMMFDAMSFIPTKSEDVHESSAMCVNSNLQFNMFILVCCVIIFAEFA
jgi:hypothetical protein